MSATTLDVRTPLPLSGTQPVGSQKSCCRRVWSVIWSLPVNVLQGCCTLVGRCCPLRCKRTPRPAPLTESQRNAQVFNHFLEELRGLTKLTDDGEKVAIFSDDVIQQALAGFSALELYQKGAIPLTAEVQLYIIRLCRERNTRAIILEGPQKEIIQRFLPGDLDHLPRELASDIDWLLKLDDISFTMERFWKNDPCFNVDSYQTHDNSMSTAKQRLVNKHVEFQLDHYRLSQKIARKHFFLSSMKSLDKEMFFLRQIQGFSGPKLREILTTINNPNSNEAKYIASLLEKSEDLSISIQRLIDKRITEIEITLEQFSTKIGQIDLYINQETTTIEQNELLIYFQFTLIKADNLFYKLQAIKPIDESVLLKKSNAYGNQLMLVNLLHKLSINPSDKDLLGQLSKCSPRIHEAVLAVLNSDAPAQGSILHIFIRQRNILQKLQAELESFMTKMEGSIAEISRQGYGDLSPTEYLAKQDTQLKIKLTMWQSALKSRGDYTRLRKEAMERLNYLDHFRNSKASPKNDRNWRWKPSANVYVRKQNKQYALILIGDGIKDRLNSRFIALDGTKLNSSDWQRALMLIQTNRGFDSDRAGHFYRFDERGHIVQSDLVNGTIQVCPAEAPHQFVMHREDLLPTQRPRMNVEVSPSGTVTMTSIVQDGTNPLLMQLYDLKAAIDPASGARRVRTQELARMQLLAIIKQAMHYVLKGKLSELSTNDLEHIAATILALKSNEEFRVYIQDDPVFLQFEDLFFRFIEKIVDPLSRQLTEKEMRSELQKVHSSSLPTYDWQKELHELNLVYDLIFSYREFRKKIAEFLGKAKNSKIALYHFATHIAELKKIDAELKDLLSLVPQELLTDSRPNRAALTGLCRNIGQPAIDEFLVNFYEAAADIWDKRIETVGLTISFINKELRDAKIAFISKDPNIENVFKDVDARFFQDAQKLELNVKSLCQSMNQGPKLQRLEAIWQKCKRTVIVSSYARARKLYVLRNRNGFNDEAVKKEFFSPPRAKVVFSSDRLRAI